MISAIRFLAASSSPAPARWKRGIGALQQPLCSAVRSSVARLSCSAAMRPNSTALMMIGFQCRAIRSDTSLVDLQQRRIGVRRHQVVEHRRHPGAAACPRAPARRWCWRSPAPPDRARSRRSRRRGRRRPARRPAGNAPARSRRRAGSRTASATASGAGSLGLRAAVICWVSVMTIPVPVPQSWRSYITRRAFLGLLRLIEGAFS